MMGLSRKMPGTNCIFDEMSVIYPNYTNAAGKEKKGSGTAVTPRGGPEGPQPLRSGRGVEGGRSPPLTGEMRRRGAKRPFDCNRIPGLCPGGGSFSARRRRSPRPNSKKWPAGHFFDTRVSAACMLRRTRRCSSACRRSATAAAASRPSRQSPCPASRTKGSSAWTTPSSTE